MLAPLDTKSAEQYQNTTLTASRRGTGLPQGYGLRRVSMLGKGSNNVVFLYKTKTGQQVVLRQPRRKSDTQRIGNATWEFRNTCIAVEIGVAPELYDAWYNRHATADQKGGLHMICAYYPKDVHALIIESPFSSVPILSELRRQCVSHLRKLADANLFCYDLKPSNMVFREQPVDVRFIDFGRDFSEWRPYSLENEYLERAPVLSFLQTLCDKKGTPTYPAEKLYADIMHAAMVVLLSSNLAFSIDNSSTASRASFQNRAFLNFMGVAAADICSQMRNEHISIVKKILRHRDVRDTLRHYMGRRNCGTKRCFAYAGFVKP